MVKFLKLVKNKRFLIENHSTLFYTFKKEITKSFVNFRSIQTFEKKKCNPITPRY